jgi:formamidopyrimidine-DNA glycosylase
VPELPEVETLCRQLNVILIGKRIMSLEILDPRLEAAESSHLAGRRIERVSRQGKTIQIDLGKSGRGSAAGASKKGRGTARESIADSGLTAALHLRMTGRLLWQDRKAPIPPYTRLVLTFAAGRMVLVDPRRFATFRLQPSAPLPVLVENPLEGLPSRRLWKAASLRRLPVKCLLMDQRLIAGIGNIYACEILHAAGVDPQRQACSLSLADWRKLDRATATILTRAVDCRGTSISDWRDLFGKEGENQRHLNVYARQGKACHRCGKEITRKAIAGRGTWLCPACQR